MRQFFKTLALAPRGIRHKLIVAFALMSIIPMLVCGYLIVRYIFPTIETLWDISLIFLITIFLICMGFYLAKKIIYPIMEIAAHAKGIAEGDLTRTLDVEGEDEVAELSGSLNRLSLRLKANMSELRSYGEKIKQINMEINKKVFALSGLLQIGNLITTVCNLDEVFNLIVKKLSQLQEDGTAFLMLSEKNSSELPIRAWANMTDEQAREHRVKIGRGPLGEVLTSARALVVDAQKRPQDAGAVLPLKNIAALPIASAGRVIGILAVGNNKEGFVFSDDEIELIGVFAKQASVAIENELLMRKTEELTVKDELTGLYNENYIRSRLGEEINRAVSYQRPCCFVLFEIDNFKHYRDVLGEITAEKTLRRIGKALKENITEIDKAARFSDHQFAVILPEKNKAQSLNLAENIIM